MTPLERAARALVADLTRQANIDEEGTPHIYDDALSESIGIDGRVDCVALTRAVIAAIREPSEAMVQAAALTPGIRAVDGAIEIAQSMGQDVSGLGASLANGSPMEQAFAAMIDALLAETK